MRLICMYSIIYYVKIYSVKFNYICYSLPFYKQSYKCYTVCKFYCPEIIVILNAFYAQVQCLLKTLIGY